MSKKIIVAVLVLALILGVFVYMEFDRIALFTLSKLYNLDISYKSLNKGTLDGFVFENLRVMNKKMGLGFFSSKASLKPLGSKNFLKTVDFDFKFKDVHFIKSGGGPGNIKYGTINELVSMPFEGKWVYKEISGEADIFSNGLTLKRFLADGRAIRLKLSGDIFYNNAVDVEISLYFSKDVLKDVPPELHTVIMKDEPDEWKSFSVKLKGNLSSPAVQISGKLFRLNVGTVVMK